MTLSTTPARILAVSPKSANSFWLAVSSDDLYLANRALIERSISHVCRRHRLSGAEGEDFASIARLALIEDDHARIRAFSGRSSLQTYLVVVITRLFQDWRNSQWGKWRPSAEAKRLGPLAVKLETMTVRDGLTFEQAIETLRTNHGATETRAEFERLVGRFPVRPGRSFTSDEILEYVPGENDLADSALNRAQAADAAAVATTALDESIRALPPQDRLILKMRFESNLSVADIATAMKLEQKPLYRRIDRLLLGLRKTLEEKGFGIEAMRDVISNRGFDLATWESRSQVRQFEKGGSPAAQERVS